MPAYGYAGSPWAYERTKQIDRTKTGIFLLLIGTLLSWIPIISLIGYVLLLVGAILVILGRKAFGPTHSRNVIISIVMFFLGIVVAVVVVVIAVFSNLSGFIGPGGVPQPAALVSALGAALIGGIVGAAIIGIAEVLFTYALQNPIGRVLLWAAYGANVALSVVIFAIISPQLSSILSTGDYNRLAGQQGTLQLLGVIPTALFAAADYLAWSRISHGEIPAPPAAPPMAPTAPPPWNPPSPPTSPPPSGSAPPINPQ